jgi:hypothetical protein
MKNDPIGEFADATFEAVLDAYDREYPARELNSRYGLGGNIIVSMQDNRERTCYIKETGKKLEALIGADYIIDYWGNLYRYNHLEK